MCEVNLHNFLSRITGSSRDVRCQMLCLHQCYICPSSLQPYLHSGVNHQIFFTSRSVHSPGSVLPSVAPILVKLWKQPLPKCYAFLIFFIFKVGVVESISMNMLHELGSQHKNKKSFLHVLVAHSLHCGFTYFFCIFFAILFAYVKLWSWIILTLFTHRHKYEQSQDSAALFWMAGETLFKVFCRKEKLMNVEGLTCQHVFAVTNESSQSSLTSQFHSNEQYCILTVQLFTYGLKMLFILIFKWLSMLVIYWFCWMFCLLHSAQ